MAGSITVSTISNDTGVFLTQNAMNGISKSWVNFNGSSASIRSSFNVSSVVRNGTGNYTINFTVAMPDANYAVTGTQNATSQNMNPSVTSLTASSVTFFTSGGAGAGTGVAFFNYDPDQVSIAIFR